MAKNNAQPDNRLHLILAGGSELHLQMLQGYLQMAQKDIHLDGAYRSGKQLLQELEQNRTVNLIFMDYFLCDTTVPDLLRQMKKLDLPTQPKILCAVEDHSDLKAEGLLSLGVDCYMIKPYSMAQLFEKARECCGFGRYAWQGALRKVILDCGISDNRVLYTYVYQALTCILESGQDSLQAKEIYRAVARHETVMESTVETSLRRAAAFVCECSTDAYRQICSRAGESADRPLGNGRFLKVLAQGVRCYIGNNQ